MKHFEQYTADCMLACMGVRTMCMGVVQFCAHYVPYSVAVRDQLGSKNPKQRLGIIHLLYLCYIAPQICKLCFIIKLINTDLQLVLTWAGAQPSSTVAQPYKQ
jgi:hypothetical protein